MIPKEQAKEIYEKMKGFRVTNAHRKKCALLTVTYIINSNPYSNPLNTPIHSTMDFWLEVKEEIEKL